MPVFKAYHKYRLKESVKKTAPYVNEIVPVADRTVSQKQFDCYTEIIERNPAIPYLVKFGCLEELK